MSLAQVVSFYLTLNVLVAVGYLGLRFFSRSTSSRRELKNHYLVLSMVLLVSVLQPLMPRAQVFGPIVRVWSAESIKSFSREAPTPEKSGYIHLPTSKEGHAVSAARVSWVLIIVAAFAAAFALFQILNEMVQVHRVRKKSFLIRKKGSVRIFLNEHLQVPFSVWLPGRADVVIPSSFALNPRDLKMALAHELQHHRQRDTVWVYILWALKIVCALNGFVYLWSRKILELQEFAVDETLVDLNKVESQQYARCLIRVAETASRQKFVPECATGLIFLVERNLLKRRIERMMNVKVSQSAGSAGLFALGLFVALVGAAYASNSWVQDRRVTKADALKMSESLATGSGFQVEINDLVLKQLNRYVGTPEGREFMKSSLARMNDYKPLVEKKISEYGVPREFSAIPIVESGYQNLEEQPNRAHGAGLWQFIRSTAKNYGLRVDSEKDERLNTTLESDAAMRYLKANYLRFKDWKLSLMAYNIGEKKLNEAIEKTGSRDAFTIVRAGYENDTDYLARVMAAVLILNNPEVID